MPPQAHRLEDLLAEEGGVDALPRQSDVAPATGLATAPRVPVRHTLPPELPREERILKPADTACPDCGGHLKPLDLRHVLTHIADYAISPEKSCSMP